MLLLLSTTGAPNEVVSAVAGASPWFWVGLVRVSRCDCAACSGEGAVWYGQVGFVSLLIAGSGWLVKNLDPTVVAER
jgi:hypothetical protein